MPRLIARQPAGHGQIHAAVRSIPRGRVSTYGLVAELAGLPGRARLVGTVLRLAPDELGLPWHRVLNASGRISFPAGSELHARQKALLEEEGVPFTGGRVNLERYSFPSRAEHLDALLWGWTDSSAAGPAGARASRRRKRRARAAKIPSSRG